MAEAAYGFVDLLQRLTGVSAWLQDALCLAAERSGEPIQRLLFVFVPEAYGQDASTATQRDAEEAFEDDQRL